MAVDIGFGIDTSVFEGPEEDLDDTFTERSDILILCEDVYKATYSPSAEVVLVDGELRPLLFWEEPPLSFDLQDSTNDSLSQADESIIARRIEAIYAQDERFTNLRAKVSFRAGILTAVVDGDASGQALHLVLTADSNKVSFEANV